MGVLKWTPQDQDKSAFLSLIWLESLGRKAMMDFGLAGLFDRIESEFGRTVAKGLLALIGVTIVSVCLGLIWQFLSPIINWATDTPTGSGTMWWLGKVLGYVAGGCLLIGGGAAIAGAFEAKRTVAEALNLRDEARALWVDVGSEEQSVDQRLAEIKEILAEAKELRDKLKVEADVGQLLPDTEIEKLR